jgi:hypothetical protein
MIPQCFSKNGIALCVGVALIELCSNTLTSVLSVTGEGTSLVGTAGVSEAVG